MRFLFLSALLSLPAQALSVRKETVCPVEPKETCRWEISVSPLQNGGARVTWDKSVVSHHVDKPFAKSIRCNVDRSFNQKAGGYIRVWFKDQIGGYCDAMAGDPTECGVHFLVDKPGASLETARGFEVRAPAGQTVLRVEHKSTLFTQCGQFRNRGYTQDQWNHTVGWAASNPGEGTYQIAPVAGTP